MVWILNMGDINFRMAVTFGRHDSCINIPANLAFSGKEHDVLVSDQTIWRTPSYFVWSSHVAYPKEIKGKYWSFQHIPWISMFPTGTLENHYWENYKFTIGWIMGETLAIPPDLKATLLASAVSGPPDMSCFRSHTRFCFTWSWWETKRRHKTWD